jgi:hypothetical protein
MPDFKVISHPPCRFLSLILRAPGGARTVPELSGALGVARGIQAPPRASQARAKSTGDPLGRSCVPQESRARKGV